MKKFLLSALIVLMLVAVSVVGLLPAMSGNGDAVGMVNATTLKLEALNAASTTVAPGTGVTIPTITFETAGYSDTLIATDVPGEAIEIADAAGWAAIAADGVYKLTADITVDATLDMAFAGTIYGNGKTLTVAEPLFTSMNGATFRDLKVVGATAGFTGNATFAATAVGDLSFTNVSVDVDITVDTSAVNFAAGYIGETTDAGSLTLVNCENLGDITNTTVDAAVKDASKETNTYTGGGAAGFVGKLKSSTTAITVTNTVNRGAVTATYQGAAGIIVTLGGPATFTNVQNYGAVTLTGATIEGDTGIGDAAGIASNANKIFTFDKCYNEGKITNDKSTSGGSDSAGIVGEIAFTGNANTAWVISNCVNKGEVLGSCRIGGILGCTYYFKHATIENCVNEGKISAGNTDNPQPICVGGIAGRLDAYQTLVSAKIENCHNKAEICGAANVKKMSATGGIVGWLTARNYTRSDVSIELKSCSNVGYVYIPENTLSGGSNPWYHLPIGGIIGKAGYVNATCPISPNLTLDNCVNGTSTVEYFDAGNTILKGTVGIETYSYSGGMIGQIESFAANGNADVTVKNCANYAPINAWNSTTTNSTNAGGMIGFVLMINSSNKQAGKLTLTNNLNVGQILGDYEVGGMVGKLMGTSSEITGCVNTGKIIGAHSAGIVGSCSATSATNATNSGITHVITDCVNKGDFAGTSYAGGIVAHAGDGSYDYKMTITRCLNTGANVAGRVENNIACRVGGMLGYYAYTGALVIEDCVNYVDLLNIRFVGGGILGRNDNIGSVTLKGCLVKGNVKSNAATSRQDGDKEAGGLIGAVKQAGAVLTVQNCAVLGDVTATANQAGALFGLVKSTSVTVENNYYTGTVTSPGVAASYYGICAAVSSQGTNYSTVALPVSTTVSTAVTTTTVDETLLATLNNNVIDSFVMYEGCTAAEDSPVAVGVLPLYQQVTPCTGEKNVIGNDDTNHWYECRCGEIDTATVEEHETTGAWQYYTDDLDVEHHYKACDTCSYQMQDAAHNYVTDHDDTNHWQECEVCEKLKPNTTVAHNTNDYHKEAAGHYVTCSDCGYAANTTLLDHNWDATTGACTVCTYECQHPTSSTVTCTTDSVCDTCGKVLQVKLGHNYDVSTEYNSDGTNHWKVCTRDGCNAEQTDVKTPCEVGTNGTAADCLNAAVCGTCGNSFGSALGHNYDVSTEYNSDGTDHWKVCTRDGCDAEQTDVKTPCAGGTATCVAKAICTTCHNEHGAEDPNNHDFVNGAYTSDGTQHWKVCGRTGCTAQDTANKQNCAGGTATCLNKAVCTTCTKAYGSALGHDMQPVAAKAATCTEAGYTAYTDCSRCDHIEGKTDLAALGHDMTAYASNDTQHWAKCARTDCAHEATEKVNHKWGDWEVTVEPGVGKEGLQTHKCTVCGKAVAETIPQTMATGALVGIIVGSVVAVGGGGAAAAIVIIKKKKAK